MVDPQRDIELRVTQLWDRKARSRRERKMQHLPEVGIISFCVLITLAVVLCLVWTYTL
jgi:hypothetical protein